MWYAEACQNIPFYKMAGTGNDFIMVDNRDGIIQDGHLREFTINACRRKVSVGADGVILIERATDNTHDYKMRIFNADGSEAEMCGNGSRCVAVFAFILKVAGLVQTIQTIAGTLKAEVSENATSATVQLSPPSLVTKHPSVSVLGTPRLVYHIDTGVPHAVVFVADITSIDVKAEGRCLRNHDIFKPKGTNVNFVQLSGGNIILVRTYERGVEDETYACGTGSVASALVTSILHPSYTSPVRVVTSGGDDPSEEQQHVEGASCASWVLPS
eukprot:TRINITY_DN7516_c0_g1_i2.p1 TRINITY_DN7516_c0_g1~~TRINITY_DN7516_c0_g1_i2.p1  ORF type:complete len:271 (-),score=70.72 TRINITY_DN7516_c0_g1_i2:63-875(-)